MKNISLGYFFTLVLATSLYGQEVSNIPPNKPNSRFLLESPTVTIRPGLSIAGFSNEDGTGLGLQQILNGALNSENSSLYKVVAKILEKAKDPVSMNPGVDQIEYTTNVLQYLAFEALASLILEQNGIQSNQSVNSYKLNIREHSDVIDELTNAFKMLTANDKLVTKNPGDQPFGDYLDAIRSYNNLSRALDLYLAIENAYQYYSISDTSLLNEQEKTDLMNRFKADIDILFSDGLKREYSFEGLIPVAEDNLEAGNRPMKGYLALAYASMSAQSASQEERAVLNDYISTARRKASASSNNERGQYWMYQTENGSRFWAEGPFYFDFVLKDAIMFWHAIRINQDLDQSFDPFFNDWFLNPIRWLADLSTPDGSLPPLDDGNKRPIQSANLLRWSEEYGDEEVGNIFSPIFERIMENHSETQDEDQFYLVEAAIPLNENEGSEIESLTNPDDQQLILRHTDSSDQKHYLAFVGEKGLSITSGEGHEQPDQLQLLYYLNKYSFLTDGGYDRGNTQTNSTWNGYLFTNTMQYNASEYDTTFDFVTYQNEGGIESPFASILETRKVSEHSEAEIGYKNLAPHVELLTGQVTLRFDTPQSSSSYQRSVIFVKGETPYLIDLNDITAKSGRNDFVMRYYGNSNQSGTKNGWFYWDYSDQYFTSPSHRLFLYTVPLSGNFSEKNEILEIQEYQNQIDGQKIPYPVMRKSYLSDQTSDRFTTASILTIRDNDPFSRPEFASIFGDLNYLTYQVDSNTVDLFVFAADTSDTDRLINISSGPLSNKVLVLQANQTIGFSRFNMNNNSWMQDSNFTVNIQSKNAPDSPENLTVSIIDDRPAGTSAILTWNESDGDIAFYEIWKQLRDRTNQIEQPPEIIGTSERNSYIDDSITNLPSEEIEQRWFVKAVDSDSLESTPSNYTDWIYVDLLGVPDDFKLFNPFPNPMQNTGNIRYQIAENSDVKLELFDLLGRQIKLFLNEFQSAGIYTREWFSNDISSGIYILRFTAKPENGSPFQESVKLSIIN